MISPTDARWLETSRLVERFADERREILRHKWIESEKAGRDIGFDKALLTWVVRHRSAWLKDRESRAAAGCH